MQTVSLCPLTGFNRLLQDAFSDGARHGNHDAYIPQICRGQRLLDKGGPESAHGKGVPWVFGSKCWTRPKSQSALPLFSHSSPVGPLLGNVSFVYLVDRVRIAQGQQRGKRLRPCPQSAGGNIHTHWNNMRKKVFPQAVMGQRMLLLRAIALMTDAPHSCHLPLETTWISSCVGELQVDPESHLCKAWTLLENSAVLKSS